MKTIDEGYIKYDSDWSEAPAPFPAASAELERWRRPLYEAGLIGHYEALGIGFGNISTRCGDAGQFLISGTQTGHVPRTDESHYALVSAYDIEANSVRCIGPIQASSEAMTHAAIYELDAGIGAIVHAHSHELWLRLLDQLPTTDASVAYGTPQMASEFIRLFRETDFAQEGLAVMGGHDDGLISTGRNMEEAATRMLLLADSR
ncbi:MAG: class II aldolase/adducin family protein [Woeseiaceae bacterium]